MSVTYYKQLGRYNFANEREKQWCVQLYTPHGNVNELWPEDDEPEIDDLLPTEVLALVEKRLKSYWISTRREETLAKIAKIREHGHEIDRAWLVQRRESLAKQLKAVDGRIADLDEEIAEIAGAKT